MMNELTNLLSTHTRVVEVFAIVFAAAVLRYVLKLVLDRAAIGLTKTRTLYDDALLDSARKPLGWGIWILGVCWAGEVAAGPEPDELFSYIPKIREVAIVVLLVWFATRFIRFVEGHVSDPGYREDPVDPTTASAVGKLLRASIMITGVLTILQTLGFSIAGALAFGGIGGIGIGFAAKDILANFFGALMIFLDRPFSVGDWIRSPDKEIEGTVEEIGWRLTRIRTFDQRPLYVPNSVFSLIAVENPSRMYNRRIYETIGVRYEDSAVLEQIVTDVEAMLKNHPAIDQNRTLMVNFVSFGPSSMDFFVYTFTKTTVWAEYHKIKQDVLLQINEIISRAGAQIAFPTQTLHVSEVATTSGGEPPE